MYLNHVSTRMREERERLQGYLDESSSRALTAILETRLLKDHLQAILAKGECRLGLRKISFEML